MKCSYCNSENKISREHIIPAGIINLFPECEISYNGLTDKAFIGEAVIKDVCETCNGEKLGPLDEYGKNLIMNYFMDENIDKDSYIKFEYDYHKLARWIMKISFNDSRANGYDDEFFTQNKLYMLGLEEIPQRKFSLYSGFTVNTSVIPSYFFNNFQMVITRNPLFNLGGIFDFDFEKMSIDRNEISRIYNKDKEHLIYLVKFGTGVFLLFGWNSELVGDDLESESLYIQHMFPYTLLVEDYNLVLLGRCSHAYNYHHPGLIDTRNSMGYADLTNSSCPKETNIDEVRKHLESGWQQQVKEVRSKHQIKKKKKSKKKRKKKLK